MDKFDRRDAVCYELRKAVDANALLLVHAVISVVGLVMVAKGKLSHSVRSAAGESGKVATA